VCVCDTYVDEMVLKVAGESRGQEYVAMPHY